MTLPEVILTLIPWRLLISGLIALVSFETIFSAVCPAATAPNTNNSNNMTTHELARQLLASPDVPVCSYNTNTLTRAEVRVVSVSDGDEHYVDPSGEVTRGQHATLS